MAQPATRAAVPSLSLSGVTVRFGDFVANDDISLDLMAGEIHAVLGENGAGKTTLMRVVAGLLVPHQGEIRVEGRTVALTSPLDASAEGIGMVHQHFMLIPTLTVAQNVALGQQGGGRFLPRLDAIAARIREIGETYGLRVDPDAYVRDLSVASQQRVEIVKALASGARILVLDEPTAVLAPAEVQGLFEVLRMLAAAGTSIVFISHKLNEVMQISDRVTVLRRGRLVATLPTADTDPGDLARRMIGQDLPTARTRTPFTGTAEDILSVRELTLHDERGIACVNDVSLTARRGEILGIAGIDGNGQQELAEAIVGLRTPHSGTLRIKGIDVTHRPPGDRIALGLAHIPEDRIRTALVNLPVADNAVVEAIGTPQFSRGAVLDHKAIDSFSSRLIAGYDVRCSGPDQNVLTLSGGNQQKLVVGRAFVRDPDLIVAVQPVRGLDIGATSFVHDELVAQRARGAGVILVSTELDEILKLSDRILVMFDGRIVGELDGSGVDLDQLSRLMTGQSQ
ncbi:ABC transporter ATP-binding protein [Devosia sp.]|uniref:ABC transporter ATP-binding protein n=1 Tax=Devosia sp. TaxID=1871048 RepID=UPI003A90E8FD